MASTVAFDHCALVVTSADPLAYDFRIRQHVAIPKITSRRQLPARLPLTSPQSP
jgi:hypothetical protein